MSVRKTAESIFVCEKKFASHLKKAYGTPLWAFLRMEIYYSLSRKQKHFTTSNNWKLSVAKIINILFSLLMSLTIFNPIILVFRGFIQKIDCVVYEHPRGKLFNGEVVDIYSYFLVSELKKKGARVVCLDKGDKGVHTKSISFDRYYADGIVLLQALAGFLASFFLKEDRTFKNESEFLGRQLGISVDFKRIRGCSAYYHSGYLCYRLILKFTRPEKVFVVDPYSKRGNFVAAAKSLNIPVIELQHGIISDYHLGYSFPSGGNADVIPDVLRSWGPVWTRSKDLGGMFSIEDARFEYLEHLKREYLNKGHHRSLQGEKPGVVIISQGALGPSICTKIIENLNALKSFRVYYKLHPGEYEVAHTYADFDKLIGCENVSILKNCDLYAVFCQCEYVIGVFSTAILEAIEFNLKPVIINLPGSEYLDGLPGKIDFYDFCNSSAKITD